MDVVVEEWNTNEFEMQNRNVQPASSYKPAIPLWRRHSFENISCQIKMLFFVYTSRCNLDLDVIYKMRNKVNLLPKFSNIQGAAQSEEVIIKSILWDEP